VLRVAFGASGIPAATAGLDDSAASALARNEASSLLGVALEDVLGSARVRLEPAPPASELGRAEAVEAVREAIRGAHGLSAIGGWLAGAGLAHVVPDAVEAADAARRQALWGDTAA